MPMCSPLNTESSEVFLFSLKKLFPKIIKPLSVLQSYPEYLCNPTYYIQSNSYLHIGIYSKLYNKRACSRTIFRNFCNPARTFSACSFIDFMKSLLPARLLQPAQFVISQALYSKNIIKEHARLLFSDYFSSLLVYYSLLVYWISEKIHPCSLIRPARLLQSLEKALDCSCF